MTHNIYDSDTRFLVDPFTKALSNISTQKNRLIQNDHNSEVITFELPRNIEGHDMSLCNIAQVHYINADSKSNEQSASIYEMQDLRVDPQDDDKVLCSWLVSHNATKYAGSLTFALRFACVEEDGIVQYAWHTAPYSGLSIAAGVYIDGAPIIDNNIDVLNQYIAQMAEIIAQGTGPQGPQGPQGIPGKDYVLTAADKAEIVAAVLAELENGDTGSSKFILADCPHTSMTNGDNTFNFDEGMTWREWKLSEYNRLKYAYGPGEFSFTTMDNGHTTIDVACQPDTPVDGICHPDGTPVKDDEVITATTYYYCDLDSYGYEEDDGLLTIYVTDANCPTDPETYEHKAPINYYWDEFIESEYNIVDIEKGGYFGMHDDGRVYYCCYHGAIHDTDYHATDDIGTSDIYITLY